MLYHGQRNLPKRFEEPLSRGFVGHLFLVLRVQTGACRLIVVQRPPKDTLQDRSHADTQSQQGREALDLVVELDTQRRDMDAALEAVEDAFDAVCVARAQHGILQRPPRVHRVGDQGLPAEPPCELGDVLSPAGDVGYGGADGLDHPRLSACRASAPAHGVGCPLHLLFPCNAEQPVPPMVVESLVNGLQERRVFGDLTLPPTSRGREGRTVFLRLDQTGFSTRRLSGGRKRRSPHHPPCAPFLFALLRTTGPLTRRALSRAHLL